MPRRNIAVLHPTDPHLLNLPGDRLQPSPIIPAPLLGHDFRPTSRMSQRPKTARPTRQVPSPQRHAGFAESEDDGTSEPTPPRGTTATISK